MRRLSARLLGGLATLGVVAIGGCMTFETTLPGTLDLRKELAEPQDAPLEPKRPAFGSMDDSYFEGFVLTESTDAPTGGEYVRPGQAASGGVSTPEAPANSEIYRRVMRQWFIIGLFPILADPDLVTSDLKAELSTPGTKATWIRVMSGRDLVEFGRGVVAYVFSWVPLVGLLGLVPTRTTEVQAFIVPSGGAPGPAPDAAPIDAPPDTAASPAPETPDAPESPAATDGTANLPDAPVSEGTEGGDDAAK